MAPVRQAWAVVRHCLNAADLSGNEAGFYPGLFRCAVDAGWRLVFFQAFLFLYHAAAGWDVYLVQGGIGNGLDASRLRATDAFSVRFRRGGKGVDVIPATGMARVVASWENGSGMVSTARGLIDGCGLAANSSLRRYYRTHRARCRGTNRSDNHVLSACFFARKKHERCEERPNQAFTLLLLSPYFGKGCRLKKSQMRSVAENGSSVGPLRVCGKGSTLPGQ